MQRRIAALLLLMGLLVPTLFAQGNNPKMGSFIILRAYDLDSTTYIYPVLSQGIFPGPGRAVTVGSSTTVTASTNPASAAPFQPIGVGSVLYFGDPASSIRTVTAKASDTSITVDTAIDLSTNSTAGYGFAYQTLTTGATATDGWFRLGSPNISSAIQIQIDQLNVTGGIDVRVECRLAGGDPVSAFYRNVTTAGIGGGTGTSDTGRIVYEILPHFRECRLGLKIGGADDGNDLTTNAESISAWVTGY